MRVSAARSIASGWPRTGWSPTGSSPGRGRCPILTRGGGASREHPFPTRRTCGATWAGRDRTSGRRVSGGVAIVVGTALVAGGAAAATLTTVYSPDHVTRRPVSRPQSAASVRRSPRSLWPRGQQGQGRRGRVRSVGHIPQRRELGLRHHRRVGGVDPVSDGVAVRGAIGLRTSGQTSDHPSGRGRRLTDLPRPGGDLSGCPLFVGSRGGAGRQHAQLEPWTDRDRQLRGQFGVWFPLRSGAHRHRGGAPDRHLSRGDAGATRVLSLEPQRLPA